VAGHEPGGHVAACPDVAARPDVGGGGRGATVPGYHSSKDSHLKRLRRIEGQIRGLQRQVASDTYCIDVLTQVSAATRALESFALALLEEHLSHCVADALAHGGSEADEKVREASAAIARLVRS
jgi:DNA-binding FrmR family transcriptional regulator